MKEKMITCSNPTGLSSKGTDIMSNSIHVFQQVLESMDNAEARNESVINENEALVTGYIKRRLDADDLTREEGIELVKVLTSVSAQKSERYAQSNNQRTTKIATAASIAIAYGVADYLIKNTGSNRI